MPFRSKLLGGSAPLGAPEGEPCRWDNGLAPGAYGAQKDPDTLTGRLTGRPWRLAGRFRARSYGREAWSPCTARAKFRRYGHRRACVAAGGRGTRDEGVIWNGDPGDFYMKVIAKKFRGVWHYGVITGVVTEWVLEDYGGATQWRAVFEDGGIVGLLRS
eukprot:jgi/Tetstr1/427001/TSEL_017208.t1